MPERHRSPAAQARGPSHEVSSRAAAAAWRRGLAKGEVPWKANEIEAVADYFDVSVGELFDGLGLFRDTKKPHRMTGGASPAGAPSGTRTPDPLIKSQLL